METRKKAAQLLTAMGGSCVESRHCSVLCCRSACPGESGCASAFGERRNQKKNGGSRKRAAVVFVIGEAGAAAG